MDNVTEKEKAIYEQRQMMEFLPKLEKLIKEMPKCLAYEDVYDEVTGKFHSEKSEIWNDIHYAEFLINEKMNNNRDYLEKRFEIKLGY